MAESRKRIENEGSSTLEHIEGAKPTKKVKRTNTMAEALKDAKEITKNIAPTDKIHNTRSTSSLANLEKT